jgi:hypothetical protein
MLCINVINSYLYSLREEDTADHTGPHRVVHRNRINGEGEGERERRERCPLVSLEGCNSLAGSRDKQGQHLVGVW